MAHSILLVEDQGIASAGIEFMLASDSRFSIVENVDSINKARHALQDHQPDIVILDLFLTDGSGLDLLREVKENDAINTAIIVYSGQANPQEFSHAIQLGADCVISKADPPEEITVALEAILQGEQHLSVTVSRSLSLSKDAALTSREQEILQLLFSGLDSNEIAERLGASPATIRKHRENILNKLDAPNTVGAIRLGIRLGLIDVNAR